MGLGNVIVLDVYTYIGDMIGGVLCCKLFYIQLYTK